MADIAVYWDTSGNRADWSVTGAGLTTGSPIRSQILISIFTDRIAALDDEIPDGTGNARGWWADADEEVPIGSRMWLLSRAKQTQETLQRAFDYLAESLKWMVDDKVVIGFEIGVQWVRRSFLGAIIIAHLPGGAGTVEVNAGWNVEGGI